MSVNEAKAHGLPIVAFNIDYEPSLQSGVILVDMFDYKEMAKKAIRNINMKNKPYTIIAPNIFLSPIIHRIVYCPIHFQVFNL